MVQLHAELNSCSLALHSVRPVGHPSHFLVIKSLGHLFNHGCRLFAGRAIQVEGPIAHWHVWEAGEHWLFPNHFLALFRHFCHGLVECRIHRWIFQLLVLSKQRLGSVPVGQRPSS